MQVSTFHFLYLLDSDDPLRYNYAADTLNNNVFIHIFFTLKFDNIVNEVISWYGTYPNNSFQDITHSCIIAVTSYL